MKREAWKVVTGGNPMGEPELVTLKDCRWEPDQMLAPSLASGTATQWASLVITCLSFIGSADPGTAGYLATVHALNALGVDTAPALKGHMERLQSMVRLLEAVEASDGDLTEAAQMLAANKAAEVLRTAGKAVDRG